MNKKLSLLLAAVAVVALAIPALAQAAPELTIGGKKATQGQTVTGTTANISILTSLAKVTCLSVSTHGVVTANTGTTIQISDDTGSGNTKGTQCVTGTKPVSVENVTLTEMHSTVSGAGVFKADLTASIGGVDCTFSTAGSTFTYVSGASPAVLTVTNADFVGSPPACEPGTVNGTFTLTSTAGVVVLH